MNQDKNRKALRKTVAAALTLLSILSMVAIMGPVTGAEAGTVEFDDTWYKLTDTVKITVVDKDEDKPVQVQETFLAALPAGWSTVIVSHTPIVWPDKPVIIEDLNTGLQYQAGAVDTVNGVVGFTAPVDFPKGVNVTYTYDGINEVSVLLKNPKTGQEATVVLKETGPKTGKFEIVLANYDFSALGLANKDTVYVIYEDKDPAGTRFDTARIDTGSPTISEQFPAPTGYANTKRPTITFKLKDPDAPADGSGLDWDKFSVSLDGNSITDKVSKDIATGVVTYTPTADLSLGTHSVAVAILDKAGNSLVGGSWSFDIVLMPTNVVGIKCTVDPSVLPADDISTAKIEVKLVDSLGMVVPVKGILVDMSTNLGALTADKWTDITGIATGYIKSKDKKTGTATITVKVGSWSSTLQVTFVPPPMTLSLKAGWNLVSLVRPAADSSVSGVFGTTGKIEKVYSYQAGTWKTSFWDGSAWVGTLTSIEDGKGYWVYCNKDIDQKVPLKVTDPWELPPSYDLTAGWNLIGYTSLTGQSSSASDYFLSLKEDGNPIWVSAYFYVGGYTLVKPGAAYTIEPGQGCWIYLTEPGTLVP